MGPPPPPWPGDPGADVDGRARQRFMADLVAALRDAERRHEAAAADRAGLARRACDKLQYDFPVRKSTPRGERWW